MLCICIMHFVHVTYYIYIYRADCASVYLTHYPHHRFTLELGSVVTQE